MAINNVNPTSTSGPAVATMTPGKPANVKNNEDGGPFSTGKGGLKAAVAMKNAGIRQKSVLNVTLDKQSSAGDKVNNLF